MADCYLFLLARNDSRVLARVSGQIARLGLSLKSLSVVSSEESGICRMSFVLAADYTASDLLCRMLSRLVDVRSVELRRNPGHVLGKKPSYAGNQKGECYDKVTV